jgi:hypothetical protein
VGLDQYLELDHYTQNWDHYPPEKVWDITVKQGGKVRTDIDPSRICGITERIATWRKANQIHRWFVENVQDGVDECQKAYVPTEKIAELLRIVTQVLEAKDKGLALDLLPPADGGFFFGQYGPEAVDDEWYWEDLRYTQEALRQIDLDNLSGDLYYQSSW